MMRGAKDRYRHDRIRGAENRDYDHGDPKDGFVDEASDGAGGATRGGGRPFTPSHRSGCVIIERAAHRMSVFPFLELAQYAGGEWSIQVQSAACTPPGA